MLPVVGLAAPATYCARDRAVAQDAVLRQICHRSRRKLSAVLAGTDGINRGSNCRWEGLSNPACFLVVTIVCNSSLTAIGFVKEFYK